ncbi:MAG TPA: hypothetical protein VEV82_02915 [Actinomycetota bacterium]|nr:hypothetical protein [Actinomycetota bacterium]
MDLPGNARRLPIILVTFAVIFNLWTLRAERLPVAQLNDGAMHTQMIRWAADRVDDGHLPLDGWYPYFALGSAQFHHYPSLPHMLLAPRFAPRSLPHVMFFAPRNVLCPT